MGPHHRATHLQIAHQQPNLLYGVNRVEAFAHLHSSMLGQYVLVCLLWGLVLYALAAAVR